MNALMILLASLGQYSGISTYRTDSWQLLYMQTEKPIYATTSIPYSTTGCWCAMCQGNGSSGYRTKTVCVNSPSPLSEVESIMGCLGVSADDAVYDLGCGDGRICVLAAKEFGARAVGLDKRPEAVELSRANARRSGVEHLTRFYERDVLRTAIPDATVVFAYLPPQTIEDLYPVLRKCENLRIAVSYQHAWPSAGDVQVGNWHFWRLRGEPVTMRIKSDDQRTREETAASDATGEPWYVFRVWTAGWCGVCRSPAWQATLARVAGMRRVRVETVDFDRYRGWCVKNGITSVPTVQLFRGYGEGASVAIKRRTGAGTYEQLAAMMSN